MRRVRRAGSTCHLLLWLDGRAVCWTRRWPTACAARREVRIRNAKAPNIAIARAVRHNGIDEEEDPVGHEDDPCEEGECFGCLGGAADIVP